MTAAWELKYETLAFARRGGVLTIMLNDPSHLNAVGEQMHNELANVFADAATDADSRVVVLTGAGRVFSAGGDIAQMQEAVADPAKFLAGVPMAKKIVFSLLDLEKPIIAKINGHAVGLGATLALFCDVTFMAETARIGDPHVAIGLVAGDGGAVIWPQLVGFARAKEFLMTGELLTAKKAEAIGLINHCVPADALDSAVDAFCDRLASGATQAIRWTKTIVNIELKRIAHALLDTGLAYESLTARSHDHAEAVAAFADRRKPDVEVR
jgi:enoyl-CoA hydratase